MLGQNRFYSIGPWANLSSPNPGKRCRWSERRQWTGPDHGSGSSFQFRCLVQNRGLGPGLCFGQQSGSCPDHQLDLCPDRLLVLFLEHRQHQQRHQYQSIRFFGLTEKIAKSLRQLLSCRKLILLPIREQIELWSSLLFLSSLQLTGLRSFWPVKPCLRGGLEVAASGLFRLWRRILCLARRWRRGHRVRGSKCWKDL